MNNLHISFIRGCPNSDFARCYLSLEVMDNPFILYNGPKVDTQTESLRRLDLTYKNILPHFKQKLSPQSFFLLLSGEVYVEFEDGRPAETINSLNFSNVWSTCSDTFDRNCNLRITGFPQTNLLKFKLKDGERTFIDACSVKCIKLENTTFNYNLEPNSIAVLYSDQNYYFNGIEIDANTIAEINSKNHNSFELTTSNTCYVISVTEK